MYIFSWINIFFERLLILICEILSYSNIEIFYHQFVCDKFLVLDIAK